MASHTSNGFWGGKAVEPEGREETYDAVWQPPGGLREMGELARLGLRIPVKAVADPLDDPALAKPANLWARHPHALKVPRARNATLLEQLQQLAPLVSRVSN